MGVGAAELMSRMIEEEKQKAHVYLETLKRMMRESDVCSFFCSKPVVPRLVCELHGEMIARKKV